MLLACSGPGAADAISQAFVTGWVSFLGAAVMVAVAVGLRHRLGSGLRTPGSWGSGLMLLGHPGWWLSGRIGDCGVSRVIGSIGWSAFLAVWLLGAVLWAVRVRRRSERHS